jgi:hypothetical protein
VEEESKERKLTAKRKGYENSGRPLSHTDIQSIYTLAGLGYSKAKICRELGLCLNTVTKYLKDDKGTPRAHAKIDLPSVRSDGSDYNIAASLGAALALVNVQKNHLLRLAYEGKIPDQVTPLMTKQLIESERMILTLPQDLNKGRRDLYEQINGRALEAGDGEVKELAGAGEMGA